MKSNLAKNLKHLRKKAGLSKLYLEKASGIGRGNVANYENGAVPNAERLKLLADFFNVTTDALLFSDLTASQPQPTKKDEANALASELDQTKDKVIELQKELIEKLKKELNELRS